MLQDIGSKDNVPEFIERVKAKKIKLMGFGHRIYKNYDPRVKIVRSILQRVFEVCGSEPLLEVAIALEEAAVSDPYFIERKLYPNVDFYTGLIYKAMGFPTDFFPVLFAIPRISGWLAHWREQLQDKDEPVRIWRPRQIYNGHSPRRYVPIELRTAFGEDPTASDRKAFYKRYFVSVSNND